MPIHSEGRVSDSPYLETVSRGWTEGAGSVIRPAESSWHMVLRKLHGMVDLLVVGPWTTSGLVSYTEGAELLWIKLKLGTFMPHLPTRAFLNTETVLPGAGRNSFWLHGSSWQFPDYEHVETFIHRLARAGVLARDEVVSAALQDCPQEVASRTIRHRFLQATGLSHSHIRQIERAQQAATLLRQGVSISDTVYKAGYFDQPHLTRALKQWVGHTPAQIVRQAHGDALSLHPEA